MQKLVCSLAILAIITCASAPRAAHARPKYSMAFIERYEKIEEAKDVKCAICHGPKGEDKGGDKKKLSDYGKALKEALGKKNVMDAGDIKKGLEKAEEADAGDDKTFGDILKDGKLPPPYKAE